MPQAALTAHQWPGWLHCRWNRGPGADGSEHSSTACLPTSHTPSSGAHPSGTPQVTPSRRPTLSTVHAAHLVANVVAAIAQCRAAIRCGRESAAALLAAIPAVSSTSIARTTAASVLCHATLLGRRAVHAASLAAIELVRPPAGGSTAQQQGRSVTQQGVGRGGGASRAVHGRAPAGLATRGKHGKLPRQLRLLEEAAGFVGALVEVPTSGEQGREQASGAVMPGCGTRLFRW